MSNHEKTYTRDEIRKMKRKEISPTVVILQSGEIYDRPTPEDCFQRIKLETLEKVMIDLFKAVRWMPPER